MSHFDQDSINALSLGLARQIDAIAMRAERDWLSGKPTRIEDYLNEVPLEGRAGLLEELLMLDAANLRQQGKQPSQEDWSKRFPDFHNIVQRVVEAGRESEQTAVESNDAFQHRFPAIPGYSIQRQLGRGAMGVVYLARHERLQRLVALKVVAAGIELKQAMAIIRAEAEIIARLKHPNIVQVYDVGEDHGEPYLSLEYVDGESLRERLHREPIQVRQAAELVEQMARAMHHAHVHGVVHRDLKPANILLPRVADKIPLESIGRKAGDSATLVPKISDFGLAKVVDAMNEQTQAGSLLGTPKYMAPEQAEGRSREVGPVTDVYALGAIFFEMLTGQTPFEGESSLKLLQRITEQEVVFSDEAKRQLPRDLQAICLKCLEKSPSRRYASAQELADDVRRFLDDFPVLARQPSRFDLLSKFVRRNQGLTISAGLILTTLVAGSIGTGFFAIREADARRHAEVLAQNESEARLHVESLRKKERRDVYWANVRMAHEAYKAGHVDDMKQLLQDVMPRSAIDQDLRGFEWHYLWRLSQPDARVLKVEPREGRVRFSSDGRWLASPDAGGLITIWDTSTWKQHMQLRGHPFAVTDLDFSPDGKKLASGSRDGTARLWDLATGTELCQLSDHSGAVRSVGFSPDGRHLLTADEVEKVILWNLEDAKQLWHFSRPELFVMDVAWAPDGRRIALGCGRGVVNVLSANDGKEIQQFQSGHQFWLTGVAFSPDGQRLATSGGDKKAKVWDLANTTTPMELSGHTDWLTSITFSADGSSIATSSRDGTIMLWDAQSGRSRLTLKGHSNWVMSLDCSPDGQHIASSSRDGTVRIWNPTVDWEFRTLPIEPRAVPIVAVADEGRKLITGYADGSLSISDVSTGTVIHKIQAHSAYLSAIAVSPDGRSFVTASHAQSIKLWDLESCQELMALAGHSGAVLSVAFSPSERRLASIGSDYLVRIWDQDTGNEVHQLKCDGPLLLSVDYSPDGQFLAAADGIDIRIWNTSTWKPAMTLKGHSHPVQFVTFNHDGSQIATCGADQTIRLWDASSGQQFQLLKGHSGVVSCVVFTRDGNRILSCGHDGTIRLWETESGRELLTLNQHSDWVNSVSLSPDEDYIVSGSNDQSVKLIELQHP